MTTQALQFVLLYFIIFVLSARHSLVVGTVGPMVYGFIGTVFGFSKLMPDMSFGDVGLHIDLAVMCASVAIIILAKVHIDRSKLELFEVLESQKEQIVTEKVLRYEAEFAKEAILFNDSSKPHCQVDKISQGDSLVPSNVHSAPAILEPLINLTGEDLCLQGTGDCLPSHAMVWTETAKLPQNLCSLVPGDKILCYDNLAKNVTYAKIEKLQKSTNTEWVNLLMQDGSTLQVTTDHPVAVQPERGAVHDQRCMRAGMLKAGRDRIMMLKMVWVPISAVSHFSSAESESAEILQSDSITISVEQRERHEIFVTTGDKNGNPGPPIAVGSSDRSLDLFGVWKNKNTFVHFAFNAEAGLKRSNSDPGLMGSKTDSFQHDSSIGTTTSAQLVLKSDTSTTESACTSSISKASESGSRIIKIGRAPYDEPLSNVASLSAVSQLKSKGIPSFGSEHPASMCVSPCSFQFSGLVNPARRSCTAGALCEYCHDPSHHSRMTSKLRKPSRVPQHIAQRKIEQI
jgi:hypothetical protein